MALYKDYESIFNCFSKMIADNTPFEKALQYCCNNSTPQLAEQFKKDVLENKETSIKKMIESYFKLTKEGHDGNQLLNNWKPNTPPYIYNEVVKKLNIQTPAKPIVKNDKTEHKADFATLEKYINAGFFFYPCNDDKTPICKIKADGKPIAENRIYTSERLNEFLNGNGTLYTDTGTTWNNKKQINVFSIYPNQYNLFCIDIDGEKKADGTTHGIGTNGINEFLEIIKNIDMTDTQKQMFDNFPANFPCYVATPNGGIHLYFKLAKLPTNWNIENNVMNHNQKTNVECKYNKQITIAGSIKDGKQYILHGDICNIPFIPIELLNTCCKPRPIPQPKKRFFKAVETGKKNKITPQFCINRGKDYAGICGHNELFASVVSNFHYFYEQTHNEQLNASNCKTYIMQDSDFLTWQDNDKETQLDNTIKQFYGRF